MRISWVPSGGQKNQIEGNDGKRWGLQKTLVFRKWPSKVGKSAIVTLRCMVRYVELFEYLWCPPGRQKIMGFGGGQRRTRIANERGNEFEKRLIRDNLLYAYGDGTS